MSCGGGKKQTGLTSQIGAHRGESGFDDAADSAGAGANGAADVSPDGSSAIQPERTVPFDEAIAVIEAYEPPADGSGGVESDTASEGVDSNLFELLKAELLRLLTERFGDTSRIVAAPPAGDAGLVTDLAFDAESGTISWSYVNLGDYDLDGEVGVSDITPIAQSFGARTNDGVGDDALEAWIDGDGDGEVGVSDITTIAQNFLARVAAYRILTCDLSVGEFAPVGEPVEFGDVGVFPKTFTVPVPEGASNYISVEPLDAEGNAGARNEAVEITLPPTIIGVSPTGGFTQTEVQFSTNVTGTAPFTFAWDFGGAAEPNISTSEFPTVELGVTGIYEASVTVTNVRGSDTFVFQLTVIGPVEPPEIRSVSPTEGFTGEEVEFDASVQGTPPFTYAWDFGGAAIPPISTESRPIAVLGGSGDFNAKLTVSNSAGHDTFEFLIIVTGPTDPPVIKGVNQSASYPDAGVTFSADLRGMPPFTYYWDFGGGAMPNVSTKESPEVTLRTQGTYNAALVVSNPYGQDIYYWEMSAGSGWRRIMLNSEGSASDYPSLALDSAGYAHISYYDATNNDLKYAYVGASGWATYTVDSEDDVGQFTSIAVDSNNLPHIAYYAVYPAKDLKYAHFDGQDWLIESVAVTGDVGRYASIALDSLDRPHISYYDGTNYDLKYVYHNGTQWYYETVDSENYVGHYSSIAIDDYDQVHIAYYYYTDGDLRYAFNDGTGWQITTIDTDGKAGTYISITLDSFNKPHIAYTEDSTDQLRYAFQIGLQWVYGEADINVSYGVGICTSIDIDSTNHPHITTFEYPSQMIYVYYTGTDWITLAGAPSDPFFSASGYRSSIKLDSRDCPHIAFNTLFTHDLYYAWYEPEPS
jgi:hypothetical protein